MSSCGKMLHSVGSSHLVNVDSCNFSERAFVEGRAPCPDVEAANDKRDQVIILFCKHRTTAMACICIYKSFSA